MKVFEAIIQVWKGRPVSEALNEYSGLVGGLPGYDLEYILQALNWIFEQEDINFTGRPVKKQQELDKTLRESNVILPPEKFGGLLSKRLGSQLAVSLFCDLTMGTHPVDALRKVSLDIVPAKRSRGAV